MDLDLASHLAPDGDVDRGPTLPLEAGQGGADFEPDLVLDSDLVRDLANPRARRALAWLVDAAVIAAAAAPPLLLGAWVVPGGAALSALAAPAAGLVATMAFTYATLSHALLGATAGKRLAGLRVIGPDGRPPSFGRSAARAALSIAGAGALGLPLALALFTKSGRTPHDLALGTSVVRA